MLVGLHHHVRVQQRNRRVDPPGPTIAQREQPRLVDVLGLPAQMPDDVGDIPFGADRPALPLGVVEGRQQLVPGCDLGVAVSPRGGPVGAGDRPRGGRCDAHVSVPLVGA
jgi:hypothetical protein